jgi:hypothetical protein
VRFVRPATRAETSLLAASPKTRNYGGNDRELLLRTEAEVALGSDVGRVLSDRQISAYKWRRPRDSADSPPGRLATARGSGGAPTSVARPRAYARPWSSAAVDPVGLAAAIAQKG